MTYESPEERRQRVGIIEVPLPGKSAKKLNGGSHLTAPNVGTGMAQRAAGKSRSRFQTWEIESHKAERAQSEPLPVAPAPAYVSVFSVHYE